jgi:hypothetical protein
MRHYHSYVHTHTYIYTQGKFDPVNDAVALFIDFVAIFVRILVIILKNQGKGTKKNKHTRRADEL